GSPTRLTAERILTLAEEAGYDQAQLEKDMADPLLAEAISVNRELATALGLRGTPGYVIGGKIIPGAEGFEALMAAVEEARKTA
ncbi:MAG: DsbA family protein, partial [Sphingomonadales bacterium]